MQKIKNINDFTISEFEKYIKLISEETDIFELLEFFGVKDPYNIQLNEFNKLKDEVTNQFLIKPKLKEYYKINGQEYFVELNITKLSAGQFIDLQMYIKEFKLEQILSIFMLPVYKKNIFGKKLHRNYNDGYDVLKVQDDLLNNMKIGDANSISDFFLSSSQNLLKIIQNSLIKKMNKKLKVKKKLNSIKKV